MTEVIHKIIFSNESLIDNNKVQRVSFDMTEDSNMATIVSEFRMFLFGMGFQQKSIDKYIPYCEDL